MFESMFENGLDFGPREISFQIPALDDLVSELMPGSLTVVVTDIALLNVLLFDHFFLADPDLEVRVVSRTLVSLASKFIEVSHEPTLLILDYVTPDMPIAGERALTTTCRELKALAMNRLCPIIFIIDPRDVEPGGWEDVPDYVMGIKSRSPEDRVYVEVMKNRYGPTGGIDLTISGEPGFRWMSEVIQ